MDNLDESPPPTFSKNLQTFLGLTDREVHEHEKQLDNKLNTELSREHERWTHQISNSKSEKGDGHYLPNNEHRFDEERKENEKQTAKERDFQRHMEEINEQKRCKEMRMQEADKAQGTRFGE